MPATHNVNLKKALAGIRRYPGARTDRKIFRAIADYADAVGVATPTQKTISSATGIAQKDVSESVHRLADKGFMTIKATMDDACYYRNAYQIAPPYLLDSALAISGIIKQVAAAYIGVLAAIQAFQMERIEELEQQLDGIAECIDAGGEN